MVKYGLNRVQLPLWLKQSQISGFLWYGLSWSTVVTSQNPLSSLFGQLELSILYACLFIVSINIWTKTPSPTYTHLCLPTGGTLWGRGTSTMHLWFVCRMEQILQCGGKFVKKKKKVQLPQSGGIFRPTKTNF